MTRKNKADEKLSQTKLFIGGLSQTVSDDDIDSHFNGIGPIRRCFVVKDPASGKSRRIAFVDFALEDHATLAISSLHGSILHGRSITVRKAFLRDRRSAHAEDTEDAEGVEDTEEAEEAEDAEEAEEAEEAEDAKGAGAAENAGDAEDAGDSASGKHKNQNSKVLKKTKKVKQVEPDKAVTAKVVVKNKAETLSSGAKPMRTVILRRRDDTELSEEQAVAAFEKVTKHKVEHTLAVDRGREVRCMFSKWHQAGSAAAQIHGDKFNAVIDALRTGERTTIIVRNLPFRVSVAAVKATFLGIAKVRNVRLAPPKLSSKFGRKAAAGSSGDVKDGKDGKDDNVKAASEDDVVSCGGYAFVEFFLVSDANHAVKQVNGKTIGGRTVAVDIAMGRSLYKSHKEREQEESESDSASKSGEEAANNSDRNPNAKKVEEAEKNGNIQVDLATQKPGRESRSSPEELGRTVFVRNLAFHAVGNQVWNAMQERFGKVEQAVVVKDRATGRSRGTAFVRFAKLEDAKRAIEAGEGEAEETNAGERAGIWLHERKLTIVKAVNRAHADQSVQPNENGKASAGFENTDEKRSEGDDPRNLRLAWVGRIDPASKQGKALSEQELESRAKAEQDKRFKLARNPNAFISKVRLCVRNLPREIDELMLKAVFRMAVATKRGGRGRGRVPKIAHCTITKEVGKAGAIGRSKGFGFVEFAAHADALAALEVLNNNERAMDVLNAGGAMFGLDGKGKDTVRKIWGPRRRLFVEFSVEDWRKVKLLNGIKERGKLLRDDHRKSDAYDGDGDKKFRGKKRPRGSDPAEKPVESSRPAVRHDDRQRRKHSHGKKSRR